MDIPKAEKTTILKWHAKEYRPEEGRYILLQHIDPEGNRACTWAAYEGGKFIYLYPDGAWGEINEAIILGWSYLPFDD